MKKIESPRHSIVRTLAPLALYLTLAVVGCTDQQPNLRCYRPTTVAVQNRTLDLAFRRGAAAQAIKVHLAWAAPGAPFYTSYGPLQSVTLTEGALTVMVPPDRIGHIEDMWPDRITLYSAHIGSYDLTIPNGVPVAAPEIITIRSGRFVSLHTAKSANP